MTHRATARFWQRYEDLPAGVRDLADRSYDLLKSDPRHPSLHFKKSGRYWSVRIGLHFRALAVEEGEYLIWFWIGTHAEYDRFF